MLDAITHHRGPSGTLSRRSAGRADPEFRGQRSGLRAWRQRREEQCRNRVAMIVHAVAGLAALALAVLLVGVAPSRLRPKGWSARPASSVGAVGGISIDADGVLANAERDNLNKLRDAAGPGGLAEVPGDLQQAGRAAQGLAAQAWQRRSTSASQNNRPLARRGQIPGRPAAHALRASSIPSSNDIVLAGFGEGWKVGSHGEIVGATTGRAGACCSTICWSRCARPCRPRKGASRCSIDPTAEGLAALSASDASISRRSARSASHDARHRAGARPADDHGHRRAGRRAISPACWWRPTTA